LSKLQRTILPELGRVKVPHPNQYCICGSQKKFKNCCYSATVVDNENSRYMTRKAIAGIEVYRPRKASIVRCTEGEVRHLREKYQNGEYTDWQEIDEILKYQIEYFKGRLEELIHKLAGRGFFEFLMDQYDRAGKLDDKERGGELSGAALESWLEIGSIFKRTIKFIAERVTLLATEVEADFSDAKTLDYTDELFICAEQLIDFCIWSDAARLFQESCKLNIQMSATPYFKFEIVEIPIHEYRRRIASHRDGFYERCEYHSVKVQAPYLDAVVIESIGVSYSQSTELLKLLEAGSLPNKEKNNFPVVFILKEKAIKKLADHYSITEESVNKVMDGFLLTAEKMATTDKSYWNSKEHYRAYRRGMFEFPHEIGVHLTWSKFIFLEGLNILIHDVSFGQFPQEWLSPKVKAQLSELGRAQGKWFESQVQKKLFTFGVIGLAYRNSIGVGHYGIKIAPGELDFIGWDKNQSALVLLECKMLQDGSEPRIWKGHVDKFLRGEGGKKSFIEKLRGKADWVSANFEKVCQALASEGIEISSKPELLHVGFVTYSPNAASYFFNDFPCPSLFEFLRDYSENAMKWPYENGVIQLV